MLEHPNFQKTFSFNGVLIVVFNALLFDLLIIGYGGHSDITKMSELLSKLTVGGFFEAALIVSLAFAFYTIFLKELLIRVLSTIYFPVVLLRILTLPFWRAGYEGGTSKHNFRTAYNSWKEYCRFQLVREQGTAKWTSAQHLSVATFFVFILSVISPLLGFQSLGYRLLPEIQNNLGVPPTYHWVGLVALIISIFYICSNSMMAFFGDHSDNYQRYFNRRRNAEALDHIDSLMSAHKEFNQQTKKTLINLPNGSALVEKTDRGVEILNALLQESWHHINDNMEDDHVKLFPSIFKDIFAEDTNNSS